MITKIKHPELLHSALDIEISPVDEHGGPVHHGAVPLPVARPALLKNTQTPCDYTENGRLPDAAA